MRILCIGDVVGSPGRRIFKAKVKELKDSGAVHAVIVNAEN
ncbi:MAG: YmdB family metallophosphoesterase, partial [Kiritimatiellae bacterium]|nr:YmdB family metallophosphoesterase [Kiritimatiellia bacterium]